MSFDIGSVAPTATKQVSAAGGSGVHRASPPVPPAGDDAVRVDAFPASPPPEVQDAMATAADVYDKLQASGHQLSFQLDEHSGKLRIEVHDLNGQVLFTVPPSKALEIAGGGGIG